MFDFWKFGTQEDKRRVVSAVAFIIGVVFVISSIIASFYDKSTLGTVINLIIAFSGWFAIFIAKGLNGEDESSTTGNHEPWKEAFWRVFKKSSVLILFVAVGTAVISLLIALITSI